MDEVKVRELALAGECLTVEFKSEASHSFNDRDLSDAVVCLANGEGGTLLIGVEDDGRITGARPRHGSTTDPTRVRGMISNTTVPPVLADVTLIEVEAVFVLVVEVRRAPYVTGTVRGLYVRRAIQADGRPACVPFLAHEMQASQIARGELDYAAIDEPSATMDDLDPVEFERFRRLAATAGGGSTALSELSDIELGRALGVIQIQGGRPMIRRGAILLVGHSDSIQRFIPTHETAFQILDGLKVRSNVFARNPLLKSAADLFDRVQQQNTETELDAGLIRIGIPRIPAAATRELIANALVHRDYTRLGTVIIQLTNDELTVTSPGGFPQGVTLENFLDASQPRSRILADAFQRAGLVDRTGRGINRVFEAVLRTGRDSPDFGRSSSDQVVVSLSISAGDVRVVRFLLDHEQHTGHSFSLADLQILNELRNDPRLTASELALVLQSSEAFARTRLTHLTEQGVIDIRGDGRRRKYALSAATYRALESKAASTRVHGFDKPQQEQMILNFAAEHGRISRSEAAELCKIAPEDASRVLSSLRARGELILRGQRRGAHYVRPDRG